MQPTQRRTRIPLSCEPCRIRKLKCNREKPCQNCIVRNQQDGCNFRGHKDAAVPVSRRKEGGTATRQRIEQLELLVKQLLSERTPIGSVDSANAGNTSQGIETCTHGPSAAYIATSAGKTVVNGSHSVFHGGNDWHLVLQEIDEIKNTLGQEQDQQTEYSFYHAPSSTIDGTSLLFAEVAPIERLEILSTLPPRTETERLVSWFFDRQSFPISVPPILHEPTLKRELDNHWKDSSRANLIWLGLLFSILGITMLAYHQHGESLEYEGLSESLFQLYRTRTAQCLLRGDIVRCLPYTVETLRLNALAELNRKDDNRRAVYITTGVIVRTAINMGYHRDPSHSSNFSPLQAEYRRRVWSSVVSMDNMASFHIGFPRMIPQSYSDTAEPRNLHDWELSEDTDIIPASRPISEPTPVTYLIVKGRFLSTLSRVTDFNSSLHLGSYDVVIDIDCALQYELESIPPHMKVVLPDDDTNTPSPVKYPWYPNTQLVAYYHVGMCNLHRRFMVRIREDDRYRLSRERCVSSAVSLMTFQRNIDPRFYHLASARQTFALAPMLLFLELELRKKDTNNAALPDSNFLFQILEHAVAKWEEATRSRDETRKIYQLLRTMLAGYHTGSGRSFESYPEAFPEQTFEAEFPGMHFDAFNGGTLFDIPTANMGFDWASWDAFIEGAQTDGPMY